MDVCTRDLAFSHNVNKCPSELGLSNVDLVTVLDIDFRNTASTSKFVFNYVYATAFC